jgi:hypothetical protein
MSSVPVPAGVGGSFPPEMVAVDSAGDAWRKAGREGSPRLVAIAYFAFGDAETGRAKIYDYFSVAGDEIASVVANGVRAARRR